MHVDTEVSMKRSRRVPNGRVVRGSSGQGRQRGAFGRTWERDGRLARSAFAPVPLLARTAEDKAIGRIRPEMLGDLLGSGEWPWELL